MRQAEERRPSDPEREWRDMFEDAGIADLLDMFGDPDGEFAEEPGASASRNGSAAVERAPTNDGPFPDVPDADKLASGSPVDPAAPADGCHGTDLLNGAG
ncbi:MAG: hypothetical protein A9Z00_00110 [Thermobacillus sp. ZCTH02-B1]|uniref:hypothetical protein n=1 Tax=Thermobacillus sp. ZCTH02-B1 TaxID=1858795 RepID=UPI000B5859D8|nr:hypothetical protein [Thermobacillus sp. ZCTH02-B1]OUM94027.1 MAG: hypothetical protein A9Z00_00110 [Thermobacillus sp. ZCTH02-B1]